MGDHPPHPLQVVHRAPQAGAPIEFRDFSRLRPLLNSKNPEGLEIIRQVATGKAYIAIAITEPDAGSDVPAIKSTARKVEGGSHDVDGSQPDPVEYREGGPALAGRPGRRGVNQLGGRPRWIPGGEPGRDLRFAVLGIAVSQGS